MTRALVLDDHGLLKRDFICQNSTAFRDKPGIYFLVQGKPYDDAKIVYVGKAINVHARIGTHIREGRISFERYYVVPCEREELDRLERAYIEKFQLSPSGAPRVPSHRPHSPMP
jgi:hypothetical protein